MYLNNTQVWAKLPQNWVKVFNKSKFDKKSFKISTISQFSALLPYKILVGMVLTFDIVIFLVSYFYKLKGILTDLYMQVIKDDISKEERDEAKKLQEACRKTLILWVFSRQILI